ncbi:MAG: Na+/H+ antiporter NhaA [Alphaproteobacteria bacterium]|nr:Na+/H+ antiporter NhaA [Alphaproteobacteria bacterium]
MKTRSAPLPGPLGGLKELIERPAAPGLALMAAAAFAFAWANSPWAASYTTLLQTPVAVSIGEAGLHKPLLLWINDGLMALFFLLVGLEVKREIVQGELSTVRKAALPVAAAVGGMIAPALLYVALNQGGIGMDGWAIPMATDIAFALGVLALLGDRVPVSLKVFLAAFAVADDIGAVTVIALFYTAKLSVVALAVAGGIALLLLALNRLRVDNLGLYLLLGAALWVAVLKSGVHATIAGVILAMAIPLRGPATADAGATDDDHSPLVHLEHTLHPWVSWLVLPVFALANAGVAVVGADIDPLHPVALGITVGLVVGKLVGIPAMSFVAVRLGLAELPAGATWLHVVGIGLLGGIGFTMSIFIAGLAFADPALLDTAKLGIMSASLLAGTLGIGVLLLAGRGRETRAEDLDAQAA